MYGYSSMFLFFQRSSNVFFGPYDRPLTNKVDLQCVMKWTTLCEWGFCHNSWWCKINSGRREIRKSYADSVRRIIDVLANQLIAHDLFFYFRMNTSRGNISLGIYGLIQPIKIILPETPNDYGRVFTKKVNRKKKSLMLFSNSFFRRGKEQEKWPRRLKDIRKRQQLCLNTQQLRVVPTTRKYWIRIW